MSDLAAFDEMRFLPNPRRAADYYQKVATGKKRMKSRRVAITGLARNIAPVLGKTMARIERLGSMFQDYRVAIFENDSIDNTATQLTGWAKTNPKVLAVCEAREDPINPGVRCLNRAARMAYYRNRSRDLVLENWVDFDNIIVLDTDLPGGWSYEGIANTFGQDFEWDFVGSNGIIFKDFEGVLNRRLYYDVWAFRWRDSWKPVYTHQLNPRYWPRGEPPFLINSCFGGLGVYIMPAMQASKYDGTDCEHIPLHRGMFEAGFDKLYMNPSQIILY